MRTTLKTIGSLFLAVSFLVMAHADEDVVSAVHGTIKKVDSAAKTIAITSSDGTEHVLHFVDRTAVHGARDTAEAGKNSWHGLKEGSEVVAHYTRRGSEETAVEIDKVGKDGLKSMDGTIKDFDRGGKMMVVRTGDGIESTFRLSDHAAEDAGKEIARGTEKGAKVTVYYSEDGGKKIAHYFEKG
jgi:Cu/Ag efflux protein CusF